MASGWSTVAGMVNPAATNSRRGMSTPYNTTDQLQQGTYEFLWDLEPGERLNRAHAMRLPAVSRSRHLLASTAARIPLQVTRDGEPLPEQPAWVTPWARQSGYQRMLWTVDDLLFYGLSAWWLERGADGWPIRAEHMPYADWQLDAAGQVVDLDGKPYPAGATLLIPGPHDGLLTFGQDTMSLARDLVSAARELGSRPFRLELHQTSEAALSKEERHALVSETRARLREAGGVLFTNPALEAKVHPLQAEGLVTDGREAAARDLARHCDVPAAMIDAPSGDSMTYSSTVQRLREFLTFGLSSYLAAVTARLSLTDMTPRGQTVEFDTDAVLARLEAAVADARPEAQGGSENDLADES